MVLVFGVLFAVFLILRLIPGVADGMEALKTNASNLFSQAGMAVPQAGKSLLVGAATLGVGAAVAVGGSTAVSQLHTLESETIRGQDGKTGERGKTGDIGKPGERGPEGKPGDPFSGTLTVELQEPIAVSSPITVYGPETVTLNGASLQALEKYITQLAHPALSEEITTKMNEVANKIVNDKIGALNIGSLDRRLQKVENQQPDPRVSAIEQNLNSFTTTFGTQLNNSLSPLKDEVTATRTAIEGLNTQPGSGPRNVFSRVKGAFKGDKYWVTYQSLTSLGLLIRKSAGPICPTDDENCCPSASPSCPDKLIFKSLESMIGEQPLDENAFWKKLKGIWDLLRKDEMERAAKEKKKITYLEIDDWKVFILRQTRVSY